jgi:hypothetical protein
VLRLAHERAAGERFVAVADRLPCAGEPALGVFALGGELFGQQPLVGDDLGGAAKRRGDGGVHFADRLAKGFFGVLEAVDEIVQVGGENVGAATEEAHVFAPCEKKSDD